MRIPAVAAAVAAACSLACASPAVAAPAPPAASPAKSWAHAQIQVVTGHGILGGGPNTFAPEATLTQRQLAAALEALALLDEEPRTVRYRATVPGRAVTIRELNAALVGFVGLGDAARAVTAALRAAELAPKAGAGTEVVARLLGLRFNHPAANDALERGLHDAATRAEAAFSLARVLELSDWHVERVRTATAELALPELDDLQRQILRRAVSFVGFPYIWGGTSERPQQLFGTRVTGGFDCSGFVWRVFKLEPFAGASALATVLRGRTTYELSGEVGPGKRIRKAENLQPGDLIFQGDAGPKSKPAQVGHAGIYLGGGWFVHSSGNGTTLHPFDGWYRDRFAWARRPLREAGLA
ncbi:MAG TPA: NlpC/P60 family protein [Gaiellaceae bacterium]|nr:NlpC/P60 family protein [Gaiellaceae bacterium]